MKSVFEELAAMRESLERLQTRTEEIVRQIKQRDESRFNEDFVLQLEQVAENFEESIDLLNPDDLHADSCPLNDGQTSRVQLRIQ